MSGAITFEDMMRSIVRDVVREEIHKALATTVTRNGRADADGDGFMSIAKAAAFADIAPGTLRRWIREGRVTATRAGRDLRVTRAELMRFLSSGGPSASVSERAQRIARGT